MPTDRITVFRLAMCTHDSSAGRDTIVQHSLDDLKLAQWRVRMTCGSAGVCPLSYDMVSGHFWDVAPCLPVLHYSEAPDEAAPNEVIVLMAFACVHVQLRHTRPEVAKFAP